MWIHHLTHIKNFESILERGLLPRNELIKNNMPFDDTANRDIIEKRNELNNYIPFHINWLQKKWGIPYNYKVCIHNKPENIIFLLCNTDELKNYNLRCFLYHPISSFGKEILLDNFEEELNFEEKKLIQYGRLDYTDNRIQQFLMSEILINSNMNLNENWKIIVYSEIQKQEIIKILEKFKIKVSIYIDIRRYLYRGL